MIRLPLLLAVLLSSLRLSAADAVTDLTPELREKSSKVDALAEEWIEKNGPGIAIAVVCDGKIVHEKGYGLAVVKRNVKVTPHTIFELASCSKQFTAMAVMILHDRGKLSFDDDVRKYLPALPVFDSHRPIRIRDLLNHTSGLLEYFDFDVKSKDPDFPTNAEIFAELCKHHKLQFPTGTKYEYTNTNYLVLSHLVAHITHQPFSAFVQKEIFDPVGMKETLINDQPHMKRPHGALGYERKNGTFKLCMEENIITGDGSVWSSIDDLIRWDAALAAGKLVKPETLQEGWTNLKLDNGNAPDEDYGFGYELSFKKGKLVEISHSGAWDGFGTSFRHHLDVPLTTIILANEDGAPYGALEHAITKLYRSNATEAATAKPPTTRPRHKQRAAVENVEE